MRKSVLMLVLVLGGVVGTAPAKTKKEAPLSQIFCHARYVYVETYEGDPDAYIARNYPQDYDAATAVQERLERWGRYKLVYQQQQADLVWVVWKERKGGNRLPGQPTGVPPVGGPQPPVSNPGAGGPGGGGPEQYPGGPGSRPNSGPGSGPGGQIPDDGPAGGGLGRSGGGVPMGAEIRMPGDLLAVYMPPGDESLDAPIWKKSEDRGLEPPMHLFADLADAVDSACADPGSKH